MLGYTDLGLSCRPANTNHIMVMLKSVLVQEMVAQDRYAATSACPLWGPRDYVVERGYVYTWLLQGSHSGHKKAADPIAGHNGGFYIYVEYVYVYSCHKKAANPITGSNEGFYIYVEYVSVVLTRAIRRRHE
jgi:hypothetical protein